MRYGNVIVIALLSLAPTATYAHQPRIVESANVSVEHPEISKAYYGTLVGAPHVFRIDADREFPFYVNILVPDAPGQPTDLRVDIVKDRATTSPIAVLDGATSAWKPFWEPFGHDAYLMGPEYKATATPGTYEVRVMSQGNDRKYVLAIGETESFDLAESANAVSVIPKLKKDFFVKSPADFLLSPFGAIYALSLVALSFLFGFAYRLILRRFARSAPRVAPKNIGSFDRALRAAIGIGLLSFAFATTWSPLLIFFGGFCLFEALFSWCGLFAALGRSTCPIE